MSLTATVTAPAFLRGSTIDSDLVTFAGRGGAGAFQAPDPRTLLARLPLADPRKLRDLHGLAFAEIVAYLDELGGRLRLRDNEHLQEALDCSVQWADMTAPLIRASFEQLPSLFASEAVREMADATIGIPYLEGWVQRPMSDGRTVAIRAMGARAVHIVAGNSPLISALTIIRNAIVRSDAIVKAPSNDPLTALAIARTMTEMAPDHPITRHLSVAYWKGGDAEIEERLYRPSAVEKIVAWGGFASVSHVVRYVQPGLELISLDPKRSATIIGSQAFESERSLAEVAWRAATDIGALNQLGCVNARVVYVTAPVAEVNRLGEAIYHALQELPEQISTPVKRFDPELKASLAALRSTPEWYRVYGGTEGQGGVIVSQLDEPVEFHRSLSGRVANLVPIADPSDALRWIDASTQTVGIYPQLLKQELRDVLPLHGVQRLVSLGHAANPSLATPQDAIEPLRRMAKWIVDETCRFNGPARRGDHRRRRVDRRSGGRRTGRIASRGGEMPVTQAVIVDTIEELTPEWFTAALSEGGTLPPGAAVSEVRSDLIGTGQVGMVVRSELDYEGEALDAPPSVVVKLPSREPGNRQVGIAMGLYESEVRFYREIAPRVDAAIPRLHWGEVEPESGRITLVIDDLTSCAAVGDMIAKATPEQAELAFGELVKLQAPLWNDPGLRSLPWLADPARAQLLFDAVAPAIEPFKAAYGERLEPEHVALVERLGPKAASWPAKALVDPLVVIHGDFRLDNMLFATAPGVPAISILDWQACRLGPPLLDHSIFLGSCMSTEDRRAHERDLLRGYHAGLVAAGVRDFSFEDCMSSYRISSLYPFLLTVSMSLFLAHTDRDREVWTQLLRGAAELVADLDAAAVLD